MQHYFPSLISADFNERLINLLCLIFENLEIQIQKYKSLSIVLHRGRFDMSQGRFDSSSPVDILTRGRFDSSWGRFDLSWGCFDLRTF